MSEPEPSRYTRRDLLRYSAVGLAALGGGSVLSSCSRTEPGTGTAAGTASGLQARADAGDPIRLVVGNEPPYTKLLPNGEVTGAEPDVAKAVLKRLGVTKVQGIQAAYESMIPGLVADRWDMITAGLFMNKSRCAEVLYSSPVIVSTESFALPAGNPKGITSLDDVKKGNVTIAVLAASYELKTAKSLGVPESKMQTYPLAPDALQGMEDGRVDAILLPTLSLEALKKQQGGNFEITEPLDEIPTTGSGAAFRPSDKDFHAKYDKELEAFKETSEFDSIMNQWGFDPQAAREATTKELCATEG
ncbi:MAG: ectoine/hydroxyectoine ABC transporter substrate-binding protein EhuB [Nocardioidaceae bacterium]